MFTWQESYRVGHEEIDKQHKRLFELADALHSAMTAGKGKDTIGQVLANLVSYTRSHFATEEGLMRRHSYPEYSAHKAQHDALTHQVLELQKQFQAGNATITLETMKFLKNWLTGHIGLTDTKIAAFLQGRAAA